MFIKKRIFRGDKRFLHMQGNIAQPEQLPLFNGEFANHLSITAINTGSHLGPEIGQGLRHIMARIINKPHKIRQADTPSRPQNQYEDDKYAQASVGMFQIG
ncbi:MAG: hypothetical protein BWY09_01866 [Candidatus Hydrogenedentes bacterium ADurb.Bin179]|nr:MAG: hypothetical protein BWY09_01866 [Candidatus Hydrogenedentes bacterium ADurb.Bin179]